MNRKSNAPLGQETAHRQFAADNLRKVFQRVVHPRRPGRFARLDSLKSNTAKIGNIKAYTLAALYNAPVTMGQYYTSLVRGQGVGWIDQYRFFQFYLSQYY